MAVYEALIQQQISIAPGRFFKCCGSQNSIYPFKFFLCMEGSVQQALDALLQVQSLHFPQDTEQILHKFIVIIMLKVDIVQIHTLLLRTTNEFNIYQNSKNK